MQVALGFKAHTGWAIEVVVGLKDGAPSVLDRRRIVLIEHGWAKQPYHAAESLQPEAARSLVARAIQEVDQVTAAEVRLAVDRESDRNNRVIGCGVVAGPPMPAWSVDEILAVHFRMHKAEGVLFREALSRGAAACGLTCVAVGERELAERAGDLGRAVIASGSKLGPPWGKDQKDAALAAAAVLATVR